MEQPEDIYTRNFHLFVMPLSFRPTTNCRPLCVCNLIQVAGELLIMKVERGAAFWREGYYGRSYRISCNRRKRFADEHRKKSDAPSAAREVNFYGRVSLGEIENAFVQAYPVR